MSGRMKAWLIIGASLVLFGAIIFVGVMSFMGWDFSKLSTIKYESNTYTVKEEFKDIAIITDTADVVVLPASGESVSVECNERAKSKHLVEVKNGVLSVKIEDKREWYDYIGFDFGTSKITLYIPEGEYGAISVKLKTGDVKIPERFSFSSVSIDGSTGDVECYASSMGKTSIKLSTGDIHIENASVGSLDLETSTGSVLLRRVDCKAEANIVSSTGTARLEALSCESLYSSASTGDIELSNVIATGKITLRRNTGDIELDRCDAFELFLKTNTGDVKGTLLSDKVFIYTTNTGDVDLPKTTTGGKCEIETGTGDIEIDIDYKNSNT